MENLARAIDCRDCDRPIYIAICRDGRWRPFERKLHPAGTPGTWAWRKHQGMEETELVPGYGLHYCPSFDPLGRRMPQHLGSIKAE